MSVGGIVGVFTLEDFLAAEGVHKSGPTWIQQNLSILGPSHGSVVQYRTSARSSTDHHAELNTLLDVLLPAHLELHPHHVSNHIPDDASRQSLKEPTVSHEDALPSTQGPGMVLTAAGDDILDQSGMYGYEEPSTSDSIVQRYASFVLLGGPWKVLVQYGRGSSNVFKGKRREAGVEKIGLAPPSRNST